MIFSVISVSSVVKKSCHRIYEKLHLVNSFPKILSATSCIDFPYGNDRMRDDSNGHGPGSILILEGKTMAFKEKVQDALNKVRPSLQADGGDVELVDADEEGGLVTVRLQGACAGCPMSQMTLKMGIEKVLKQAVPEVQRVESV